MIEARFLAEVFHHRWAVPVLARLAEREGGRAVEVAHALGASRGGVRQALESLIRLELVTPNPGHGHPLRPEFVLTPAGARVAGAAGALVELAHRWEIERDVFRKWPLPVVYGMGGEGARFFELRDRLPEITDRSLSDALRVLDAARLAERVVTTGRPPGVRYLPTPRSARLHPLLRRIATATARQ